MQGIESRKGIATGGAPFSPRGGIFPGCKGLSPVRGLRLPRPGSGPLTSGASGCKGLSPVRGLRRP